MATPALVGVTDKKVDLDPGATGTRPDRRPQLINGLRHGHAYRRDTGLCPGVWGWPGVRGRLSCRVPGNWEHSHRTACASWGILPSCAGRPSGRKNLTNWMTIGCDPWSFPAWRLHWLIDMRCKQNNPGHKQPKAGIAGFAKKRTTTVVLSIRQTSYHGGMQ